MKFKTLFSLFNLVILVSFLFIFFMPLPILGWEYAVGFWAQNWPIALVFLAILALLDTYFIANWKLFRFLEREDWSGLRALLEAELKKKGVLGPQKTKIFLNACLIGQNPSRINELREAYASRKVRFLPKVALSLGLPLVLEGKGDEIIAFFHPLLGKKSTGQDGPWIRWCLAFAYLLRQEPVPARPLLEAGLKDKKQPLLVLLSLYLLENLKTQDQELKSRFETDRVRLASQFTPKEWDSHIDGLKERVILVLFMEKLISDARRWLENTPQGESA